MGEFEIYAETVEIDAADPADVDSADLIDLTDPVVAEIASH